MTTIYVLMKNPPLWKPLAVIVGGGLGAILIIAALVEFYPQEWMVKFIAFLMWMLCSAVVMWEYLSQKRFGSFVSALSPHTIGEFLKICQESRLDPRQVSEALKAYILAKSQLSRKAPRPAPPSPTDAPPRYATANPNNF